MKLQNLRLSGALGALGLLAAAGANAHTGYLRPNIFSGASAAYVTLQASFTEDFPLPEIALEAQDFHLYRPDGKRDSYSKITTLKQVTILESNLNEPGTYRFTTGERLGRTSTQIYDEATKTWKGLEPGKEAPKHAKTRKSQTATVSDVYVTKGAPTQAPLEVSVGRLAIKPVTHPNAIFLEDGFDLLVTFDGKPMKNQKMILEREGGSYEEPKFEQAVETGADGKASLNFDKPGVYLLMTRFVADAPKGAETPVRSYTTSLTFEVMR